MKLSACLQNYRYMQYMCVIIVTLLETSLSLNSRWLTPVLPQLTAEDSPLGVKLTDEELSWLVSCEKLGAVAGCIICAYFMDKIGRKRVLLFAAVPVFLSPTVSAFITLPAVLISMRAVGGIGLGCSLVVVHAYIGEIAEKDIRGQLGIIQTIMGNVGSVVPLTIGPFVSYKALTLTCSTFPAIFFVLFIFMPETPYFLVKMEKMEAAKKSLYQLSAKTSDVDFVECRLQEIQTSVANDLSNKSNLWEIFRNESCRKAFLITAALKSILNLCGIFVMNSYLQVIIASSSTMTPEIASIVFGAIQLPSVILAAVLVDRSGRRPLYIVSTLGSGIALTALGIYFFLQDYVEADVTKISWLPITSLSLYLLLVNFGIYVIPRVTMSELFTMNMKGMVSSIVSIWGSLLGFIVAKSYQPLSNNLGDYTVFWVFAAVCFLGFLFGIFSLPETKGKSFIEIQAMLSSNKNDKHSAFDVNTKQTTLKL